MLLSPDHLIEGLERLRPDVFYLKQHSVISTAMRALHHAGQEVNIITLGDWLQAAGKLAEIPSGQAYLTSLCEAVFSPSMFTTYAKQVEEKWRQRQLQDLGLRLHHASQNGGDLGELVNDVERTLAVVKTPPAEPEVQRTGDDFTYTWPAGIVIALTMVRDGRDGLHAEIAINAVDRRLHWGDLRLASLSGRSDLVKKVQRLRSGFDWEQALEQVCATVADQYRAGEPVVTLRPIDHPQSDLIADFLPDGDPTILFAPPDAGKGWIALLAALSLSTGKSLPGGLKPCRQANTLYLDWEWDRRAHEKRLYRIAKGFGVHQVDGIFYRRMTRPLADEVDFLRREIARHEIGLVVVDSYFLAAGSDPYSPEAAGRYFATLRALGSVTSLTLTHTSWDQTERTSGHGRPIGTIQVRGQARSEWELRRTEHDEGDTLTVALYHTKANDRRKHASIGLQLIFSPDMVRVQAADIGQEPELMVRLSLPERIRMALRSGAKTVEMLSEECNAPENAIRARLSAHKHKGIVVEVPGEGRSKWWGLAQ